MRRADREVTLKHEIEEIIARADVCRIAFAVNNEPYIVTMNFGHTWNDKLVFYFHGANAGRKIEMMNQNSRVCFELDTDHQLVQGERSCDWSMLYASVVGYGTLRIASTEEERIIGLDVLMAHYGKMEDNTYHDGLLKRTAVFVLEVDKCTAKRKE